jgi:hypothetical protein
VRNLSALARGALRDPALPNTDPETITEVRVGFYEWAPYRQRSERVLSCGARDIVDVGVRGALAPRQV